MTRSKISYLDETLKRLPIIIPLCGIGWFGLTTIIQIKADVQELKLLSFKDKEILYNKIDVIDGRLLASETKNNENDKILFRLMAVLPTKKEDE